MDRDALEKIRWAYLSLENLLSLAGDAEAENGGDVNLSHLSFLLGLVNAALYKELGEY